MKIIKWAAGWAWVFHSPWLNKYPLSSQVDSILFKITH